MNIWLLVWFCAAAVILYFSFWNLLILIRQKQIWRAFSERTGLRYEGNGLTSSPSLSGTYKDYAVSLFMGEHGVEDQRGMRKLTAIEVSLKTKIPFEGAVASAGMKSFLVEAGFTNGITPEHDVWPQDMAASSPAPYALKKYLSGERIRGLVALSKLKQAWLILIFKDDVMLLRVDMPDALASNKKLSILLNKMVNVATTLELEQGEDALLLREMDKVDLGDSSDKVLSRESDEPITLELEDDSPDVEDDRNPSSGKHKNTEKSDAVLTKHVENDKKNSPQKPSHTSKSKTQTKKTAASKSTVKDLKAKSAAQSTPKATKPRKSTKKKPAPQKPKG